MESAERRSGGREDHEPSSCQRDDGPFEGDRSPHWALASEGGPLIHVGGRDQGALGPVKADDSVREDGVLAVPRPNGSEPELLPTSVCRLI
jgi:hypothetical protein